MAARIVLGCLTLLVALPAAPLPAQVAAPPPSSRIFRFDPDGFWLSLHHFLYVLGRAEIGTPDRTRRAVAGAPTDQTQGLASLSADEQAIWKRAVSFYAAGPSKLDTVFDAPLIAITNALDEDPPVIPTFDQRFSSQTNPANAYDVYGRRFLMTFSYRL